jgi:hypothetical protein
MLLLRVRLVLLTGISLLIYMLVENNKPFNVTMAEVAAIFPEDALVYPLP